MQHGLLPCRWFGGPWQLLLLPLGRDLWWKTPPSRRCRRRLGALGPDVLDLAVLVLLVEPVDLELLVPRPRVAGGDWGGEGAKDDGTVSRAPRIICSGVLRARVVAGVVTQPAVVTGCAGVCERRLLLPARQTLGCVLCTDR